MISDFCAEHSSDSLWAIWFQVLFHSHILGSFYLSFTVLVHYRWEDVFSLGPWSALLHRRFHVSPATLEHRLLATKVSDTWLSHSLVVLSRRFLLLFRKYYASPTTPSQRLGLGYFPVRSPLLRESHSIYFPLVTKMFQFTSLPSCAKRSSDEFWETRYGIKTSFLISHFSHPLCFAQLADLRRQGFPIRTSPDESLFASSPRLIAGYYVLLRHLLPRHPP